MSMVHGVVLDLDGTLVDSNGAHAEAWTEAFREHDFDVFVGDVRKLIGMGSALLMLKAANVDAASPIGKAIVRRKDELFRSKFLHTMQPFPESRALVERLAADGHQVAVASGSSAQDMNRMLEIADVADLIPPSRRVTGDDDAGSKPQPQPIETAVAQLGVPRHDVISIGDTPYDIEAARRAGVASIAVRSGGWTDADLRGAIAVYDDVADIVANYDRSVLKAGVHR